MSDLACMGKILLAVALMPLYFLIWVGMYNSR